jgi:hypothetical protein
MLRELFTDAPFCPLLMAAKYDVIRTHQGVEPSRSRISAFHIGSELRYQERKLIGHIYANESSSVTSVTRSVYEDTTSDSFARSAQARTGNINEGKRRVARECLSVILGRAGRSGLRLNPPIIVQAAPHPHRTYTMR